ncbi:MFS transporter [Leptodontidium sp. MPI-SDFR-AT-0119]|nr:MFS transporter [Leptodontidium sp. MPI-SDFR-AT-0119]
MDNKKIDAATITDQSEIIRLLQLDSKPWYQKPNLRALYFCLIPAALGVEMTTGYDGSVLNGLQAVSHWQDYFGHPTGSRLGVLNASYNLGGLITLPLVPWVNDKFGRKHSITLGSLILCCGVVVQAASQNYGMFLASRFLLGTGIPFAVSGAAQLLAELTYPKERAVVTGLFNVSWFVGAILAAGVTLGTYSIPNDWSWRIPSMLQAAPSLLQLTFIWWVPESPRWLISKDRDAKAFEILVKYHGEGDRDSPFVNAEFVEIQNQLRLESLNSKRKWIELLQTPGNRKRVLIVMCLGIFAQWSGNGLISYYLAKVLQTVGIKDKRTQNIINLSLSCWSLITAAGAAFATIVLRRRVQYLTSFVSITVIFSIITALSATFAKTGGNAVATGVIAFIFIFNGFFNIMQPLMYIYATEIFPFIYRAKGLAILQFFNRGSTAFNTFVNPIGLDSLKWKYYLFYAVWLVCETMIVYFLYPETKGPSLEEVAMVFDGERNPEKMANDDRDDIKDIGMNLTVQELK